MVRHILPNALAPTIVVLTIALGSFIALEATLSFLGVTVWCAALFVVVKGMNAARHEEAAAPAPPPATPEDVVLLREIRDLGIDGAISIELEFAPRPDQIVEWVREAYEGTARLMREATPRDAEFGLRSAPVEVCNLILLLARFVGGAGREGGPQLTSNDTAEFLHPELFEMIRRVDRPQVGRVVVNSNGVRIATDEAAQ